jgi:hypothetical protein
MRTGAVATLKAGYELIHTPRAVTLHGGEAVHEGFDLVGQGLIAQYAGVCMVVLILGFFFTA